MPTKIEEARKHQGPDAPWMDYDGEWWKGPQSCRWCGIMFAEGDEYVARERSLGVSGRCHHDVHIACAAMIDEIEVNGKAWEPADRRVDEMARYEIDTINGYKEPR